MIIAVTFDQDTVYLEAHGEHTTNVTDDFLIGIARASKQEVG